MHIDYDELERRVIEKLANAPHNPNQDKEMAKFYDNLDKEITYVAIHVLAEYDKMNKELHT